MTIQDRKWELMKRDSLCREYDESLCASLNDWTNPELNDSRMRLEKEVKDKWCVNIYIKENFVKIGQLFKQDPKNPVLKNLRKDNFIGLFKWWTISGTPHSAVIDAREGVVLLIEGDKMVFYSFEDNNLVYCDSHKIPIIINPSLLSVYDAQKVKDAVWKIVKGELEKRKQHKLVSNKLRGEKWNPPIPKKEPSELAKIFHLKESTFRKYLEWYDLKMAGLPFRFIAVVESGNVNQTKKKENYEQLISSSEKLPKIRKRIRGESAIRRGFNLMYQAIHRDTLPAKEQDIRTIGKYSCPEHGNVCSSDCNYLKKWMAGFDKTYKEKSLIGTPVANLKYIKPSRRTRRRRPLKTTL